MGLEDGDLKHNKSWTLGRGKRMGIWNPKHEDEKSNEVCIKVSPLHRGYSFERNCVLRRWESKLLTTRSIR